MKMRVAASVAIAGLIVLGASGCEFISPQDTTQINQVSDGMDASVGPVGVRDALLVTATGTEASLIATFVNSSSSPQTVSMQYTSSTGPTTQQVIVPADGSISVRPGAQVAVTLSDISTQAGGLFPVYFTTDGGGKATVRVPVLDATQPDYSTLTPTPTPVVPAPTPTPFGSAGTSPTPTTSATPAA